MAEVFVSEDELIEIADAIRTQEDSEEVIPFLEFAERILDLEGGGILSETIIFASTYGGYTNPANPTVFKINHNLGKVVNGFFFIKKEIKNAQNSEFLYASNLIDFVLRNNNTATLRDVSSDENSISFTIDTSWTVYWYANTEYELYVF